MTPYDFWTQAAVYSVGGGSVLVLLRHLPTSYLDKVFGHYLERKMESLKHEYSGDIERLKSDLSHLQDRGVRSNEKEFHALTEAWGKFMDAFYAVRRTAGGLTQIPDFTGLTGEETDNLLDEIGANVGWKRRIKNSSDPSETYRLMLNSMGLNDAERALNAVRDTIRRQSVFIPIEINEKLEAATDKLTRVFTSRKISAEIGRPLQPELSSALLTDDGEQLFNDIRASVRARLLKD